MDQSIEELDAVSENEIKIMDIKCSRQVTSEYGSE
jgi:hypothetical protein